MNAFFFPTRYRFFFCIVYVIDFFLELKIRHCSLCRGNLLLERSCDCVTAPDAFKSRLRAIRP
jgi:hypothetical protein